MAETVRRSSLASLGNHDRVNLERAMRADGRFGGHMVTGHIDGCGVIESVRREENAVWVRISADEKILDGIVEKGSVAIDGISLTVAAVDADTFSVSVIPHTCVETVLVGKKAGASVNLETDILGKYAAKLLFAGRSFDEGVSRTKKCAPITLEFLEENGF
jgi:riboflavin synthase